MQITSKYLSASVLGLLLTVARLNSAHAHLMVPQHGTLNIVAGGAFMVLSLSMSAFTGVDDDHDGRVSPREFNDHRAAIIESVKRSVTLKDKSGRAPLRGIVLSPVGQHDPSENAISEVTIMGRFTLNDPGSTLRFQIEIYGGLADEQSMEITATRRIDSSKQVFTLTPTDQAAYIFADGA